MDVVILAGGKCDPELAELTGVEYRSDLPIQARTIVERVIDAVHEIGDVVLVGGPVGIVHRRVEAGSSFIGSLRAGLDAVKTDKFLLVTGDLPCLSKEHVLGFLEACDPAVALNYPIIPIADCEREFPGMKRTTLKLRDGEFTGGNIGLMRTELVHRAMPILEKAYSYRKSPLKLASLVGIGTSFRVAVAMIAPKTLSLSTLERSMSRFLQVPVKAVVTHHASIGADIDNAAQYKSLIDLMKTD